MSKYSFPQLMSANLFQWLGESLKLDNYPARVINDDSEQIGLTEGGATLVEFIVARRSQSSSSRLTRRFANSYSRSQPSIWEGECLNITNAKR